MLTCDVLLRPWCECPVDVAGKRALDASSLEVEGSTPKETNTRTVQEEKPASWDIGVGCETEESCQENEDATEKEGLKVTGVPTPSIQAARSRPNLVYAWEHGGVRQPRPGPPRPTEGLPWALVGCQAQPEWGVRPHAQGRRQHRQNVHHRYKTGPRGSDGDAGKAGPRGEARQDGPEAVDR